MDQVIRRFFIAATIMDGKLRPPKHLHTCPSYGKSFPHFYPIVSGSRFIFHSQCPYCKSYERHRETLENPVYNTDALRLKHYGQCDHVRKYGSDYQKHLEQAGFHVTCMIAKKRAATFYMTALFAF